MAFLFGLEVQDMPLNDAGIPFDFDVPAFLAGENGLVAVLVQCYSLVYLNQNPFFFFKLNKIQDASI